MASPSKVPTNVNQMINDLVHDLRGAKETFKSEGMPGLFKKYKLTPEQCAAFKEPGWQSFTKIGIAPIHQILLSIEVNPQIRQHLSMRVHMDRYKEEINPNV